MYAYDICSMAKCSMVYRGEFRSYDSCPLCMTPRRGRNGKALQQLYYLPVADWLANLFTNEELWK